MGLTDESSLAHNNNSDDGNTAGVVITPLMESGEKLLDVVQTVGNEDSLAEKDKKQKGNEDKKIFVGGIAYDVSNDDLSDFFSKFGEVTLAQVKYDRTTGRSRGFAFVEFATQDACKAALKQQQQVIKDKQCEIKPAKSRENKKVFVGGIPPDHVTEEDLRYHFEQFGKVEDIEWPCDKNTKTRRNFAFIVFEEEKSADRAASIPKQAFGPREADVKKAVPQNKRNVVFRSAPFLDGNHLCPSGPHTHFGGIRTHYPGYPSSVTHWIGPSAWPAVGTPYSATSAGMWSNCWYGNADATTNTVGNFYSLPAQSGTANGPVGSSYSSTALNSCSYSGNGYANDFNRQPGGGGASIPRQPQTQQPGAQLQQFPYNHHQSALNGAALVNPGVRQQRYPQQPSSQFQ